MDLVVHQDPQRNGPKGTLGRFAERSHHIRQRGRILGVRLKCIYVAHTRIFNNISKTSEIPLKSDYALFKKGVRPEWEDAANKEGGKWSYQFKRNVNIDELWLYTVSSDPGAYLTCIRCSLLLVKHLKRKEMMKLWELLSTQGRDFTELDCGLNPVPVKKY